MRRIGMLVLLTWITVLVGRQSVAQEKSDREAANRLSDQLLQLAWRQDRDALLALSRQGIRFRRDTQLPQ
jgi:hypothetical protein